MVMHRYHIDEWNITFALYQHKHLCFYSQATEDINPREQQAALRRTFRLDLNKSIHLSSLKNGNESSPWVYLWFFYNLSADCHLPKPSSYIQFIPKRFGTRRGKVDLLVIHTSPNSGSHLDLTVNKELLHRLPVSLVKSRVMHPDPKRQGQLQIWLSYSADDIVHLTKHTDIRNPGRQ